MPPTEHTSNKAITIGDWVQKYRSQSGDSQEVLGEKSTYHYTYISKIELGQKIPSRKATIKIATALVPEDASEERAREIVNEALDAAGHTLLPGSSLRDIVDAFIVKAGYDPKEVNGAEKDDLTEGMTNLAVGFLARRHGKQGS